MTNSHPHRQVSPKSNGSDQPARANDQAPISPQAKEVFIGLLSRAQVAHRLGTCTHTVQRMTKRGILPAIVFNRRLIRYEHEVVEAYIKSATPGNRRNRKLEASL